MADLPRLHPDARAVLDGPCGLEEWSGADWNDYAAACERNQTLCLYRFVHIDEPAAGPRHRGIPPMTTPTVPLTKSDAIDRITDIEHLRQVAHRMWEAFYACHSQSAHCIGVLMDHESCTQCMAYIGGDADQGCEEYQAWQAKVTDGFGSI